MNNLPYLKQIIILLLLCCIPGFTADFSIFPSLPGTRCQTWPVSAFSTTGNCWLVVCEEGYLNELNTDLYCGRVSADGSVLDPAAIVLCKAVDVQEHAAVACNGTDFFVVWQDMRNGTDYDVYGARVTSAGVVLDTPGILIAGGAWNQCMPSVTWAGGQYHVAFQSYNSDTVGKPDYATDAIPIGYQIWSTTVSTAGVVGQATSLCPVNYQSILPTALTVGNNVLVCYQMNYRYGFNDLNTTPYFSHATVKLNGTTGAMQRDLAFVYSPTNTYARPAVRAFPITAVAWGNNMALWASNHGGMEGFNEFRLVFTDSSGVFLRDLYVAQTTGGGQGGTGTLRNQSIAFDGSQFLVLRDMAVGMKLEVRGMFVPADGNLPDTTCTGLYNKMTVLSNAQTTDCEMQGHCSAGPMGKFLVTYASFHGAEDIKIKGVVVSNGTGVEGANALNARAIGFSLYPNPFKPSLTASISAGSEFERVDIFDLSGRLVRTFPLKSTKVSQSVTWDGKDLHGASVAAGVYVVKCVKGTRQFLQRAVLIK